ncbi:DMT family transporter [Rubritalea spongiae]|uniref:DMT family transporter n=1 Tax=Rubritalea spongiae TaxID=430797 RepID=A0ABW5E7B5_9BACT
MQRSPYLVFLPVLLCTLLWGSAFPCIKLVYQHWADLGLEIGLFDRWLFAGMRFVIAGAVLLLLARQPRDEWRETPKKYILLLSMGQTLFQYVFFYLGLSLASGSLAALMASTGSFWWMLLAPIMLGAAWPQWRQWAGLIVGALGVTLAVYAPGSGAGNPMLGALCVMLATFFGSVGVVIFSKIKPTMGARAATGFSLFLGGVGLCLLGLPAWSKAAVLFDSYVMMLTAWLVVVSATAFAVWNHISTLYPVHLLASCRFLIPVFGVLLSLSFLEGESAGWGLVLGGVLVIGSAIFATLTKRN